jgi:dTMP kinase
MPKLNPGILISFEGTEGSGKSTLIRLVDQRLIEAGYPTRQTREPGGIPTAEKIRSILLENEMNPWTELFLYEAARAEHAAQVLKPELEQGKIVLCDRFTDSTLAYQAHARGLPWKEVKLLNRLATLGLQPDLTVLLDIDPAVGLERAQDPNRFEAEGLQFHKKVRAGFIKARSEQPKRWLTLRVQNRSPEELAASVLECVFDRFKKRLSRRKE